MIKVTNLSISYGENKVIDNINFVINTGELVLIKGGNGKGKSTLCYALSGLIPNSIEANLSGSIKINDIEINLYDRAELSRNIGIVFQNPDTMLFSSTVEDELAFAPENLCIERNEIRRRVEEAISLTGIEKLRYKGPSKLSGGEKKRVAIASVLTLDSKIIIFDEVFSCLDSQSVQIIVDLILMLKNKGKTIIIVEHTSRLDKYADKVINLNEAAL